MKTLYLTRFILYAVVLGLPLSINVSLMLDGGLSWQLGIAHSLLISAMLFLGENYLWTTVRRLSQEGQR